MYGGGWPSVRGGGARPRPPRGGHPCAAQRADRYHRSMTTRPFLAAGSAAWADFERIDLRVGRIVAAEVFPEAQRPAYRLVIDLGAGGLRRSSAQLPATYPDPAALIGRLVAVVANLEAKRIAGFRSEVLVLGALPQDGRVPLLSVDAGAAPGDPIG
jgi:tRNA-binding protein